MEELILHHGAKILREPKSRVYDLQGSFRENFLISKKNQEYPLPYDVFIDIKRDQSHEVGSEQSREFLLLL